MTNLQPDATVIGKGGRLVASQIRTMVVKAASQVERPVYAIGSVANALAILLMFRERKSLRVSDVSSALGVSPSTAHRLLAMLEYQGFARKDPKTRTYLPGPALVEVGLAAVRSIDVRTVAQPHLVALRDETDETVLLVGRSGDDVVFLDCYESHQPVRVVLRPGTTLPAHCSTAGRAILAALTQEELRAYSRHRKLARVTDRSITSRAELVAELEKIQQSGFARSMGEYMEHFAAVAVAIREPSGSPVAALSITAPNERLKQDRVAQLVLAAQRTAHAIERGLTESDHTASVR